MTNNYVSVSGGADSTAVALLLWERREDFTMIFADTGAELPEVYWLLPRLAEKVGKELVVVSNGGMFRHIVNQGYLLPHPKARWCTRLLKVMPIKKHFGDTVVSVAVGIRADEKRRTSVANVYPKNQKARFPLVDAGYGKEDVMAICKKHDLLNSVYNWRTNVSCFCCPMQRKSDWLGLLRNHPELYFVAEEWEKQSGKRCKSGRFTWNATWALENLRIADQRQLRLLDEPKNSPCELCPMNASLQEVLKDDEP